MHLMGYNIFDRKKLEEERKEKKKNVLGGPGSATKDVKKKGTDYTNDDESPTVPF